MLLTFRLTLRVFFATTFVAYLLSSCQVDDEGAIDLATLDVWENFTTSDGLADNFVFTLFEDSRGNIWIGTASNGVSRFNGTSFTNFNTSDGLNDNSVLAITEDDEGIMWFGTENGLSFYDGSDWFFLPLVDGFQGNALLNDQEGNIWMGFNDIGILVFSGSIFSNLSFVQIFDNDCSNCNFVNALYRDGSGNIWAGSDGGAKRFVDINSFTLFDTGDGLAGNTVTSFQEDTWGDLWIGTFESDKITRYNGSVFENVSLANSQPQNWVRGIVIDNEANVWFGTVGNGLIVYDGAFMRTTFESPDGLPDNTISSMIKDSQTNIWVGTSEGGVSRYISK